MICYEVLATVSPNLVSAWEHYMRSEHIPDVLESGCFTEARFDRGAPGQFRIQYHAPDMATLERYFTVHAPALRADAMRRFPEGVALQRATWSAGEPIRPG